MARHHGDISKSMAAKRPLPTLRSKPAFRSGQSPGPTSREPRLRRNAARVFEAATNSAIVPNLLARSLATKATHQVAVLVDDFSNPYKLQMLELLTAALQAEQMTMMLININRYFDHANAIVTADQRQVDATILLGTDFKDETLREISAAPFRPAALRTRARERHRFIPSVACDPHPRWRRSSTTSRAVATRPGFMSGPRTLSTVLGRGRTLSRPGDEEATRDNRDFAGRYDVHPPGSPSGLS